MADSFYTNKIIWIIGASEGIGHALALHLDSLGAQLILSARNEVKLTELSAQLHKQATIVPLDVSNYSSFQDAFNTATNAHNIDAIIYFPALYTPMTLENLDLASVHKTINANLTAVFSLFQLALPYLKDHASCTLAVTGSVAGYIGLPNSQPYAATKAGVINLVESAKAEHPEYNIKLISPGFVKTRLTEKNTFKMPALLTPEQAAKAIIKQLKNKRFEIHFPKRFTRALKLIALLPYSLSLKIIKNFK
jgi:short-subunit dehydrogenase